MIIEYIKVACALLVGLGGFIGACAGLEVKYKIFSKMAAVLGDKLTVNVLTKVESSNDVRDAKFEKRFADIENKLDDRNKLSEERHEKTQEKLKSMREGFKEDLGQLYKEVVILISESDATQARYRILRFNDEVLEHRKHSREHFDQILEMIDNYETYCDHHPNYENSKCVHAIENIRTVYKEHILNGGNNHD